MSLRERLRGGSLAGIALVAIALCSAQPGWAARGNSGAEASTTGTRRSARSDAPLASTSGAPRATGTTAGGLELRAAPADVPLAPTAASLVPADHAGGITRCELCHTTASWTRANFDHDRTGFPLTGKHVGLGCRECHRPHFDDPIARTCAGCHRDAHRGELGQHCEGCHTTGTWVSTFGADAHRRTNFPLDGRHAVIPCAECHGEARDRVFTRTATPCVGCHLQQYLSTASSGAVNHVAFGLSQSCRDCHSTFRFKPARFPQHDRCFPISSGPHSGIACLTCHSSLQGASLGGTCNTNTAACSSCHAHSCGRMDEEHREVAGYECRDRKCYECHINGGGGR